MNRTGFLKLIFAFVLLATAAAGFAQVPGGEMNAAITRLFGDIPGFTAVTDVQMLDRSQKELLRTPMSFSVLGDKLRVDVDYTKMKTGAMPPEAVASFKQAVANFKQLGMDRIASIVRPDKKTLYIVYPNARSYIIAPMSATDAATAGQKLNVEKSPLGQETVDGHPCVKNHTVIKDAKGTPVVDATTWNATDLKDFPVQIATRENENVTVMRFQNLKFTKPEAKDFDLPAGYAEYPDPQALKTALTKKLAPPAKK